ncbi:hypothetical protein ACTL6U_04150 [Rhodovibrionaceae bacterium A322]
MDHILSKSQSLETTSYAQQQSGRRVEKVAVAEKQEAPVVKDTLRQNEKKEAPPPSPLPPISPTKVTLNYDQETNQVVAFFVDRESGEVTHQIPAEDLLKSSAELRHYLEDLKVDLKV